MCLLGYDEVIDLIIMLAPRVIRKYCVFLHYFFFRFKRLNKTHFEV